MRTPVPNPLRLIGLARCLAGAWFIASAIATLRLAGVYGPLAARLFRGEIGGTDAPIRSLLVLVLAVIMLMLGIMMIARGLRWYRHAPAGEAAPLDRDEVMAALTEHRLPAYGPGRVPPRWPLRTWLGDEMGRITGWRRDLVGDAARQLARATMIALGVTMCWLVISLAVPDRFLGPFPFTFVIVLPFMAAVWASLALLLVGSPGPRIESVELPVPIPRDAPGQVIESRPDMVGREPPALGTAIALLGVVTQSLLPSWWTLETISYPLLATSLIRFIGSIIGGVLFLQLGNRMIVAGAELLRRVQHDSTVILIAAAPGGLIAHAAAVRTESRDPGGERQIVSAVAGAHAREAARKLLLLH